MTDQLPDCLARNAIQKMNRDGSIEAVYRCAQHCSVMFSKDVTIENCQTCPVRVPIPITPPGYRNVPPENRSFGEPKLMPDGSIVYPRTGWEPPAPHAGYRCKSNDPTSDDAWIFVPIWEPCVHRELVNHIKPCGCLAVNPICTAKDSGYTMRKVDVDICGRCPVRRPIIPAQADQQC